MVVVGLIGLLLSLLMPALDDARDQTKLTLCRSHLRNLGVGTVLYANANKSWLPLEPRLDNPHHGLMQALGKHGYVDDAKNYYCPAVRREDLTFSEENVQAGNISYFYYACRQASRDYGLSTFLRWEVAYPRAMRDTTDPDTWVLSDAWYSGEPTAHHWYKKGVNYYVLGGTVKMLQKSPRREFQ